MGWTLIRILGYGKASTGVFYDSPTEAGSRNLYGLYRCQCKAIKPVAVTHVAKGLSMQCLDCARKQRRKGR